MIYVLYLKAILRKIYKKNRIIIYYLAHCSYYKIVILTTGSLKCDKILKKIIKGEWERELGNHTIMKI